MISNRLEREVVAGIIAYLSTRKDILWWRQNTGAAQLGDFFVKFGVKGMADIIGFQAPTGQFFAIEGKREVGGRISPDQERFRQNVILFGGKHTFARSVQDVETLLGPVRFQVQKVQRKRIYPP